MNNIHFLGCRSTNGGDQVIVREQQDPSVALGGVGVDGGNLRGGGVGGGEIHREPSSSPMARRYFSRAFASLMCHPRAGRRYGFFSPPSPPHEDRHKSGAAERSRTQIVRQRACVGLFSWWYSLRFLIYPEIPAAGTAYRSSMVCLLPRENREHDCHEQRALDNLQIPASGHENVHQRIRNAMEKAPSRGGVHTRTGTAVHVHAAEHQCDQHIHAHGGAR